MCPWARGARQRGEVAVEVLWGTPDIATWIGAAKHMLAQPAAAVAMVIAPELSVVELKYNKFYIGLAKGGQPNNFVIFRPKKDWLRLEVRLDRSDETQAQLDGSSLDVMDYDSRWGRYRIRLVKGDTTKHKEFLTALMTKAFEGAA